MHERLGDREGRLALTLPILYRPQPSPITSLPLQANPTLSAKLDCRPAYTNSIVHLIAFLFIYVILKLIILRVLRLIIVDIIIAPLGAW